jgi:GT2 family glycosyltransferase
MTSVSIVTFNSGAVIGRCLASLAASLDPNQPVDVTVVDNGSTDDTLEVVTAFVPRIPSGMQLRLVRSPENLGYGRAHNLVIAGVTERHHVICNPDIIFRENTLKKLGEYLDEHPDVGIVCPAVLNEDLTPQHLNKRLPTVLDLFLRRFLPKVLTPIFRQRLDRYEMKDVGYEREVDVPFVSGAFLFCRAEALRRVGGFDPRYFLYFEDVDLSRSVQRAGFRTVFLPTTSVVHLWARAAHKSPRIALAFIRNGLRYFGKWGVDPW